MGQNHPGKNALLTGMLFFTGMAAYGQDLPMTVEIKMAQSTVKNNEEFPIFTTIHNTGKDEQSLEVWSCSYPGQWTPDNPVVHITPAACKKNDIIRVRLKPGEVYERDLSIHIGVAAEHRVQWSITFRLGLEPAGFEKARIAPLWSNAVTVNVTE